MCSPCLASLETTSRLLEGVSLSGPVAVHFAITKVPRIRVLSGSPDLTNMGNGGAWCGFHARKEPADFGSRVILPTVYGNHPLIRFNLIAFF